MSHLRAHWKKYLLGAAAGAGLYYGIPPEASTGILCSVFTFVCP